LVFICVISFRGRSLTACSQANEQVNDQQKLLADEFCLNLRNFLRVYNYLLGN
jgi:hypothetical protein